jgi:hypothetical protein
MGIVNFCLSETTMSELNSTANKVAKATTLFANLSYAKHSRNKYTLTRNRGKKVLKENMPAIEMFDIINVMQ